MGDPDVFQSLAVSVVWAPGDLQDRSIHRAASGSQIGAGEGAWGAEPGLSGGGIPVSRGFAMDPSLWGQPDVAGLSFCSPSTCVHVCTQLLSRV